MKVGGIPCFYMYTYIIVTIDLSLSADLAARLQELKNDDETIDGFGKAMKDWVSICP